MLAYVRMLDQHPSIEKNRKTDEQAIVCSMHQVRETDKFVRRCAEMI